MSPPDAREEARALLVLDLLPGVGLAAIAEIVEAAGSATGALAGHGDALRRRAGSQAWSAARDPALLARVDAGLATADRLGMHIVTWNDDVYPEPFRHLHDPPPVLFLRGRTDLFRTGGVTVVGPRRATARGRDIARRLGRALGRAGFTVVSGMALGIDGAAHEGALDVGGDTIAVLGRGADAPYPPSHRDLFERIVERGLVVSEFMPGVPPEGFHFPRRNRILAALPRAVVLVEAPEKSGAHITVDHALDLGVEVWVVPGPIDEPACAGSNERLNEGAKSLASIDRFIGKLTGGEQPCLEVLAPAITGPEGDILTALGGGVRDAADLAVRAGLPLPRALALLTALELGGHVEQLPGMRFRRVA